MSRPHVRTWAPTPCRRALGRHVMPDLDPSIFRTAARPPDLARTDQDRAEIAAWFRSQRDSNAPVTLELDDGTVYEIMP